MRSSLSVAVSATALTILVMSTVAAAASIVQQTCMKIAKSNPNVNYNFCLTSLGSDPKSGTMNLEQLGLVSLRLGITSATKVQTKIKALSNQKGGFDDYGRKCLTDCQELYSDAMGSLKQAVADFGAKDFRKANLDISAASTDSDTCEDQFGKKKREVSPLNKENGDFSQLTSIALALSNMLQGSAE